MANIQTEVKACTEKCKPCLWEKGGECKLSEKDNNHCVNIQMEVDKCNVDYEKLGRIVADKFEEGYVLANSAGRHSESFDINSVEELMNEGGSNG